MDGPYNSWDWWLSLVTLQLGDKDIAMELVTQLSYDLVVRYKAQDPID